MGRKKGKRGSYKTTQEDYWEEVWGTGFFVPIIGKDFNYFFMGCDETKRKIYKKKDKELKSLP